MYLVVGLGNPGTQYEQTRHNAGFLALDAFSKKNFSSASFKFDKNTNAFLLEEPWDHTRLILVKPQTFMNKSGAAVELLWHQYNVRDWLLQPEARAQFSGRHFQNTQGVFLNPFRKGLNRTPIPWQSEREERHLIVIHDDIDLPLGKLKISLGSGAGGHKGVESIIKEVGTQNFARVRIGIQPENGKPANVEEVVIQKFTSQEKPIIETATLNAVHALEMIIADGLEKTMNEYN